MANFDHDLIAPIGSGLLAGWGLVLAPVAAVLVGVVLGKLAAANFNMDPGIFLALAFLVLPALTIMWVHCCIINLVLLGALVHYLLNVEHRLEVLLGFCWLTGVQIFLFLQLPTWSSMDVWDRLRALGVFAIIPGVYVPLRIRLRRRTLALERELDEERLRRLRGESPAAERDHP